MGELIVFAAGAAGYSIIEILWRGYTHWTMSLTGGLCLLLIYIMNFNLNTGLFFKSIAATVIITAAELAVGMIVNVGLGWHVWDYSALPLNFKGQICVLYSFFWFVMSIPIIKLCNLLKTVIEKV